MKAYMIKEIKDVINTKGDKAKKIYYYDLLANNTGDNKKVNEVETDGKIDVSNLKSGDIVKFALKDGLVGLINKVCDADNLYDLNGNVADFHINHATGTNGDHYNAYFGVVYSYEDGQLQIVTNASVKDISDTDGNYQEKIDALEPTILNVSSSVKVTVIDSSAKNTDDMIVFYESAESVMQSITGNGVNEASRIFASRNDEGAITAIVIFK